MDLALEAEVECCAEAGSEKGAEEITNYGSTE